MAVVNAFGVTSPSGSLDRRNMQISSRINNYRFDKLSILQSATLISLIRLELNGFCSGSVSVSS